MISLSKDLPWSLWILAGIQKALKHFSTIILATVRDFWLFVMKSWLYLEKVSVRTRILSLLPFTTSAFVKSIKKNSKGWWATKLPCWTFGSVQSPFPMTHHLHWVSQQSVSTNIVGQYTLSHNRSSTCWWPWWPLSSWSDFKIWLHRCWCKISCWISLSPLKVQWCRTPHINDRWSNCNSNLWIGFDLIWCISDSLGFEFVDTLS